ncbi:DUF3465 domain-containing protein [Psychrobacter arenosus]|uniref:DUF3465 domain-containing protein n=1 Tax=Psychrobacter arenosus TaxID=256326 RepID=UPI00191925E4|nr:DUF3465 domain-containing protein [Psychrobacter arenosus]
MVTPKKLSLTATLLGSVLCFGGCTPPASDTAAPAATEPQGGPQSDQKNEPDNVTANTLEPQQTACQNELIVAAFQTQRSDVQVKGCGSVIKVLADDNEGSRHQKFLIKLAPATDNNRKLTLLIAHNIDLAPRVANLSEGDEVSFYGEYEFNPKGGVVHWTHHDPAARHQHGWIERAGQRYE